MALRVGMGPPHNLLVTVSSAGTGRDLSAVTFARFRVWRSDEPDPVVFETGIWPPVSQTASELQLLYVLSASGTDLTVPGVYRLRVEMTVPDGVIWSVPRKFAVLSGS